MEQALHDLGEMDALASRHSPIHALCPLSKLLITVIYILVTVSFPKYALPALTPMVIYPAVMFAVSGIPVRTCFYKLRFVLPLVTAVGLLNPLLDRTVLLTVGSVPISGGVISMMTLLCKGVFCLAASFLLMATTSIDALCSALRQIRIPGMMVTLLLLTYRYVGVMTEELSVMTDAYHLRAPGQKGINRRAWGSFLGQLLLRSMDRAEELYAAMQLRGYHGHFHYVSVKPFSLMDSGVILLWVSIFFLLRSVNISRFLGSLFL